jgi:hypothetical protein
MFDLDRYCLVLLRAADCLRWINCRCRGRWDDLTAGPFLKIFRGAALNRQEHDLAIRNKIREN